MFTPLGISLAAWEVDTAPIIENMNVKNKIWKGFILISPYLYNFFHNAGGFVRIAHKHFSN